MTIVVICNLPPPAGGAEIFGRDLAVGLSDLGLKIIIITQQTLQLRLREANDSIVYPYDAAQQLGLYERGVEILTDLTYVMEPENLADRTDRLTPILQKLNPDLVHCHMPTGLLRETIDSCETLRIPVVSTMHEMTNLIPKCDSFLGPEWSSASILALMQRATHNVVVSRPMLEYCQEENLSNVSMISGGLCTDYFSPENDTDRSGIVYVGKLNRYKGLRQAISGFLRIADRIEDRFYLVGRGITAQYFERTGFFLTAKQQVSVQQMLLSGRLVLRGEVLPEELQSLYRRCRVMVLPSLTEGMPISILEALSCGTPVIASSVGSIPDVIRDGENGFLIKPGNITEYSKRLEQLLNTQDPGMVTRCRQSICDYDINHITARYFQLFQRILQGDQK